MKIFIIITLTSLAVIIFMLILNYSSYSGKIPKKKASDTKINKTKNESKKQ